MVGDLLLREGRGLLLRAPHYRYWPPYSLNPGYGPARPSLLSILYTVSQKVRHLMFDITLANMDRFSKFFHQSPIDS